jgi:hypothetical protein
MTPSSFRVLRQATAGVLHKLGMSRGLTEADENLVRQAIQRAVPTYGKPLPELDFTPQQLRERAANLTAATTTLDRLEAGGEPVSRRTAVKFALATGLTVAGFAAIPGSVLLTARPAIAAPDALEMNPLGEPATDHLLRLASTLAELPRQPIDASYLTHTHLQRWTIDTTEYSQALVAHDERAWWYPDRSGRTLRTTLPPQPAQRRTAQYLGPPPAGTEAQDVKFGPGEFPTLIPQAPSTDPNQLANQLATHEPPENGPQTILRGIAAITAVHHLHIAQTIAALQLLATTPTTIYRGETLDRAGRRCLAITIDSGDHRSGTTRDILLIDSSNGSIRGHEQIALTPLPQAPNIPLNTVIAYTLHLKTQHQTT